MALEIKALSIGIVISTNCYIVRDTQTGKTLVIDPGIFDKNLDATLTEMGVTELEYILLTHGHFDHISGAAKLQKKYGGKIAIHSLDAPCLKDSENSRAALFGFSSPVFDCDNALADGDIISFGESVIKVIHTPGHTVGSVCFIIGDNIFSGDTLFRLSYGRTDFPGGSDLQMMESFRKLKAIEGQYKVFPGHEEFTDLDFEKKFNPLMRGI